MKTKSYISLIISLIIICNANLLFGQQIKKSIIKITSCPKEDVVNLKPEETPDTNKIYNFVEHMPQFKKGDSALIQFFSEHLIYPEIAIENGVQGAIHSRFEIRKDGEIGKIEILIKRDEILNKELIKVIKSLPRFIPGTKNNKPVNVWYYILVDFKCEYEPGNEQIIIKLINQKK